MPDYHIYLDKLHRKVEDLMSGHIASSIRKSAKGRSKSQEVILTEEDGVAVGGECDGTATFISEQGIFDQYNDILTERFYGEEPEY